MLKPCRHSNCAVCKMEEDRNVFKSILRNRHPDVFFCEHAVYKITDSSGKEIILISLDLVSKNNTGYFIEDIKRNDLIYLNKNNFQVLCTSKLGCYSIIPYVKEYVPKSKIAAD